MAGVQTLISGLPAARIRAAEELPIQALRRRLTISFVGVLILIYLIACVLAMIILSSSLNASLDSNLKRLLAEIQPAVKLDHCEITLRDWATNAAQQQLHILHVVQLYDRNRQLREQYGVPGVRELCDGRCQEIGLHNVYNFRSKYVPVQNAGFLQIQIDTKQTDQAFAHFLITMLVLVPVVAITAGVAGYIFCGKALAPVAQSVQVLRRFVDDAGHELRTPVAIILASIETLEHSLVENQTGIDVVDKISRAGQRLKNLSQNLILLAKMESPELELELRPLNAAMLARQVCADFQKLAADKKIQLVSNISSPLVVLGDTNSLHRMLSNLVDNAIRYTHPGGTVTVSCSGRGAQVIICVEDSGIGIPIESIDHIFERFYRVELARTWEQGGTGLGLSIVKAIVLAHSGSISVESQVGKGSKFTVTLFGRSDRAA